MKLKVADWINLALKPFRNIRRPSSRQRSVSVLYMDPTLWTCSLARTTSRGLVIIVVVNPPKVPAILWINKWDTHEGSMLWSSSTNISTFINNLKLNVNCELVQDLINKYGNEKLMKWMLRGVLCVFLTNFQMISTMYFTVLMTWQTTYLKVYKNIWILKSVSLYYLDINDKIPTTVQNLEHTLSNWQSIHDKIHLCHPYGIFV